MAHNTIYFENVNTKVTKPAPVGFSWTTFFFGGFVALLRGDVKWGLVQFCIQFCTLGLSAIVFAFIYNKIYIDGLREQGYAIRSVEFGDKAGVCIELGIDHKICVVDEKTNQANPNDNLIKLEKLYELKNKGAISDEEYLKEKIKLMA